MLHTTTNDELMERLNALESKVDDINELLTQLAGAWFFIKLVASVALGVALIFNNVKDWFK